MRLSSAPHQSFSAAFRTWWRLATWRVDTLSRSLILERHRLVRSLLFGLVLMVGVGLLARALLAPPPGVPEAAGSEPALAIETIDGLELWLEERETARGAGPRERAATIFAP
jgi:hypothetical protein